VTTFEHAEGVNVHHADAAEVKSLVDRFGINDLKQAFQ
jgi:hypothetical protein